MPRHIITHAPGVSLEIGTRQVLGLYFAKEEIDKLETLGGTIEIVISTVPRGIKKKKEQPVDDVYVAALRQLAQARGDLRPELLSLTGHQLRELCRKLELPSSSHLTNRQLMGSIENRLLSRRRWNSIIEHNSGDRS